MSRKAQRIVLIQDASKELSTSGARLALDSLLFNHDDKITLLRISRPFRIPNRYSPAKGVICGNILWGYKRKLDSSATLQKKQEFVDHEIAKKLDQYHNNEMIKEIIALSRTKQVEFNIKVEVGKSLKEVSVQAAKAMEATCVILDRQMGKHKRYFKKNVSCALLSIKHDKFEQLREPNEEEITTVTFEEGQNSHATSCDQLLITSQKKHLVRPDISWLCKNRRPKIGYFREFTYKEIEAATNLFSDLLSNSSKENIYRGKLPDGVQIVVKKHTYFSDLKGKQKHPLPEIKNREFRSEVQILGKASHENLAMLLGSCSEDGKSLLVCEYVCNGSLDQHLSRRSRGLTWDIRMKIALGAAKGIQYLHQNNIYGNLRPRNILITHDHEPRLASFGLARNQYEESENTSESRVMKTFEYIAPEFEETGQDSSKSDVYSFGVVLLELITGPKTTDDTQGQSFLRWAGPILKEKKYGDLIDPSVEDSHDLLQLVRMVRLVEKCLRLDPLRRLSIDQVVLYLTRIIEGSSIYFSPPDSEEIKPTLR